MLTRPQISALSNCAFLIALFFAIFEEVIWLRYLVIVFVWLMLASYAAALLRNDLAEKLIGKMRASPSWPSNLFDLACFGVMLFAGWYLTATAYAISCACLAEAKHRIKRHSDQADSKTS